jgi:HlyD family secretion protein
VEQENVVSVKKKPKKNKVKKFIVIGAVFISFALIASFLMNRVSKANKLIGNSNYLFEKVSKHDIKVNLTGSGTLKPANSYALTALISGEIMSASFEEGDIVEKDTILYEVNSLDAKTSLEKAELKLAQARKDYNRLLESTDDLKIRADKSGTLVSMMVKEGDKIQAGQNLASIIDSSTMKIDLYFNSDDADNFHVGQKADLTIEGSYETIQGTVSEIKNVTEQLNGYKIVKKVSIEVKNPGALSPADKATAIINKAACVESGNFTYKSQTDIKANVSGNIKSIKVKEGDIISENQLIAVIDSTQIQGNIENSEISLRDFELSLESQYKNLDQYIVKSPITGTIIDKNYKVGDKLEPGKNLCTIFDLSYLTMTLNVDELDISQVFVGQNVNITAEALPNKIYEGKVTKISINGVTANGVTVYPVTIKIDETKGLLPGMNVDASIEIVDKKDVISVPIAAVARGNRVLVKKQSSGSQTNSDFNDNAVKDGKGVNNLNKQKSNASPIEGYEYVKVEVGISNDDYIEIISGLSEGDEIAIVIERSSNGMEGMFGPPSNDMQTTTIHTEYREEQRP